MEHEKILRINELARKKRTVGLTADELAEQQVLRAPQVLQDWYIQNSSFLALILWRSRRRCDEGWKFRPDTGKTPFTTAGKYGIVVQPAERRQAPALGSGTAPLPQRALHRPGT